MNYGDFKTKVAAYINRDPSLFVVNGVDLLADAVNTAKMAAQRRYNFNQLKTYGFISTSATGAPLTSITADIAGLVPLRVKKIESVWQYDTTSPTPQKLRQINMIAANELKNILPTLLTYQFEPRTLPVTLKNRAYVYGGNFYVSGFPTPTMFWVDVTQWLDDYSDDSDTDIFLTYYRDWMLFKTLQQLNAFLKETEKIQVSTALLDKAWDEVTMHDSEMADGDDSRNLLD